MTKSTLMKHALAACCLLGVAVAVACSSNNTPTGLNCGDGAQECSGSCTVPARDPLNCGACGKACAMGEVCSQGSCSSACGGGTTKCSSECVDTKSDPRNCGGCGKACQANEVCMAGACATSCGMGTMKCGMGCVNTMTDPTNCGGCGTMCTNGQTCTGGKCGLTCAQPETVCDASMLEGGAPDGGGPMGKYCANLQEDNLNCGACGTVCSGTTPLCQGGKCVSGSCGVKPCDTGGDVANMNLKWVVCQADCNQAWVSMANMGGSFHADWICRQLGYTAATSHGGTCGKVCGYCGGSNYTCSMPGPKTFDNGGALTSDQYGQVFGNTVMWLCQK